MACHESAKTTKLFDRRADGLTLDEVERIAIGVRAGLRIEESQRVVMAQSVRKRGEARTAQMCQRAYVRSADTPLRRSLQKSSLPLLRSATARTQGRDDQTSTREGRPGNALAQ